MAVWTNIPNANLAAGAPIRSVDTLALRDNGAYNKQHVELEILNSQIFTSSGTWTKPTGTEYNATDTVLALIIGGGASGDALRDTEGVGIVGGGGGGVLIVAIPYSASANTSVTVGAGGVARTDNSGSVVAGNVGGASSFGSTYRVGGGGGGNGPFFSSSATSTMPSARNGCFSNGGNVVGDGFTGAGGGLVSSQGSTFTRTGSTGTIFGVGGNAGNNTAATSGSIPGGGGGANFRWNAQATSGAGARGEVRVFVVRGRVPASILLNSANNVSYFY